jgi:hypothetical protein
MKQDLFSNLRLTRNDSNISIGDRALIPHKGSLKEAVKLRKHESSSLLKSMTHTPLLIGVFFVYYESMKRKLI